VRNMFLRRGVESQISGDATTIDQSEKIILPGIGAFDAAMNRLRELGLDMAIRSFAQSGRPVLGICLGAQLLTQKSEEGMTDGLGVLDAVCRRFDDMGGVLKVPHIGWSEVDLKRNHSLFRFDGEERPRFYFAHSYHFDAAEEIIAGTSVYGHTFPAILMHNNVVAAQFHPEKSHTFGLRLLANFAQWDEAKN
jgi:glutamine amidotransferase